MTVRVTINGYGTIGKRVADAVTMQDDMKIVGVSKTKPTYEARIAVEKGFPLFVPDDRKKDFLDAGLKIEGTIGDMLEASDIVIDGTPGKVGATYKKLYEEKGVKAVFQGGEKHETAGVSFNALANYKEAWGRQFVRVVSCNTTGLVRTLFPLQRDIGIERVNAVMIRRAADPRDCKKGPINAIKPVLKLPSHHGPDVTTVMHDLKISTMAVAVPTTLMHIHSNIVDLKRDAGVDEVIDIWEKTPRVRLIHGGHGFSSSAEVMELAKDLGNPRGDFMEIIVWQDGLNVVDRTLYYYQAIHQESDVVPENVDCIRAMCEIEEDPRKSMEKTDRSLGIS